MLSCTPAGTNESSNRINGDLTHNKLDAKDGRALWQTMAVLAIKSVHTLIFAIIAASVLHVFWAGVSGRPTRITKVATGIVLAEAAVFFGNRWRCPLTGLAESMGADSGRVTDIFLPRWFADRIPQIFTPLFVIGLLCLSWRKWQRRKSPREKRNPIVTSYCRTGQ